MSETEKVKVLVDEFKADTPIKLSLYNPDVEQCYDLITDAKTAKYLFNHNEYMLHKCGQCNDYKKAYVLALGLDEEEVEEVLCESFFETPAEIRAKEKLDLSIERKE